MGWFSNDEDNSYQVVLKHMLGPDEVLISGVSMEEAEQYRNSYSGSGDLVITHC